MKKWGKRKVVHLASTRREYALFYGQMDVTYWTTGSSPQRANAKGGDMFDKIFPRKFRPRRESQASLIPGYIRPGRSHIYFKARHSDSFCFLGGIHKYSMSGGQPLNSRYVLGLRKSG